MKFSKLTKPELETIIENANFTEQEEEIFLYSGEMLWKDFTDEGM